MINHMAAIRGVIMSNRTCEAKLKRIREITREAIDEWAMGGKA